MGLSHAPSVVTNGLVFYYDMGNSQKSWKGAPTTNLLSISGWNTNFNGTAPYWSTMTRTMITSDLLFSGVNIGQGVTSTAASYGFGYIDFPLPTGTTAGVAYACSFWYKSASRTASVWCHDTAGGNTVYSSTLPADGKWNRGVAVFTSTATGSVRLHFHMNAGSVGDVVYFTAPMIEQQSFGTPFVNGTRSNTQALIDLTGLQTITANSLTYNSDGTFSFSGSQYCTVSSLSNFNFGTGFTAIVWHKNIGGDYRGIVANTYGGAGFDLRYGREDYYGGANNGTNLNCYIRTSAGTYNSIVYADLNQYKQYAYTYNGSSLITYKNGTQWSSIAASGNISTTANPVVIGRNLVGAEYLTGSLPIVQIYNRALSAQEIQQNFNSIRGRFGL